MKKTSTSFRNSGAYTSPGTPEYGDNNVGGTNKGWCSERVALPANGSRRHISAAALMPFNSGRALPSKWDDAERWITSPILGYGVCKASVVQPQRRPKSKSGPLGAPGVAYFSNFSPAVMLEGGSMKNFIAGSPFTTGVLGADGISVHYAGGLGASNAVNAETCIARSTSVPGWSDLLSESSLPSSQDDKLDGSKDAETTVSRVVPRRDMATQMSPIGSSHTSPKRRSSFSSSALPLPPTVELHNKHSAKVEVRDVQEDKGATFTRHSNRHVVRMMKKDSPDVKGLASPWDIAEAASTTKLQKEEAKITAWENLQKAKAEAAVRKLEMKLEKRRSSSMDKILKRLREAQIKAQEMRRLMTESSANRAPRTSRKVVSIRKYVKMGSLRGCFACHAS
ncbi:hypothetical protein RJ639_006826 [Escallonia herrerae]|uniref:Remorin C-terminal domain-containing protein n=1 Tax=Escallonia herrerae TaxID=1293975 RepID=A0AA89ASS2_9ASTE|nr:hypothetical protein RJ639_006826 [Escallonia herrerae]